MSNQIVKLLRDAYFVGEDTETLKVCAAAADKIEDLQKSRDRWRQIAKSAFEECEHCEKLPVDQECQRPDCVLELMVTNYFAALKEDEK